MPILDRRSFIRLTSLAHLAVYRASGGRVGSWVKGPVLLLTATGRKSGRPRTVPLLYVQTSPGWAVVASYAGDDRHPGWWLNLKADGNATIQVGSTRSAVTATEAEEGERGELWPRFVAMYPGYEKYRQRTKRRIPVVILQPK